MSCFPGGEVYDADDESEEGDASSVESGKGVREKKTREGRRTVMKRQRQKHL